MKDKKLPLPPLVLLTLKAVNEDTFSMNFKGQHDHDPNVKLNAKNKLRLEYFFAGTWTMYLHRYQFMKTNKRTLICVSTFMTADLNVTSKIMKKIFDIWCTYLYIKYYFWSHKVPMAVLKQLEDTHNVRREQL